MSGIFCDLGRKMSVFKILQVAELMHISEIVSFPIYQLVRVWASMSTFISQLVQQKKS